MPVARSIGRKRLMELALTGDPIDAATAADWGLVNYAVPDAELDKHVDELLARATRGSRFGKGVGKQTLYAQLDRPGGRRVRRRRRGDGGDVAEPGSAARAWRRSWRSATPVWTD